MSSHARAVVAAVLCLGLMVSVMASPVQADDGSVAPPEIVEWLEQQPGRWPTDNEAMTLSACESGGSVYGQFNYNAKNRLSTASGRWQFLDTTWTSQILRMPEQLHQWAYAPARSAPHWVQDAAFIHHFKLNGSRPWVCWTGGPGGPAWYGHLGRSPAEIEQLRALGYPWFGRVGDERLRCDIDGDGLDEQVVRRPSTNIIYGDLDHRGGIGEIFLAYGRRSDILSCRDWDGSGFDKLVVLRDGQEFGATSWQTGVGVPLAA